jgi:hypothetical protein
MKKYRRTWILALVGLLFISTACINDNHTIPFIPLSYEGKNPYLVYVSNTEMKVSWQLPKTDTCTFEWGTSPGSYNNGPFTTAEDSSDKNRHIHSYTITSLTPGAPYYYRVLMNSTYHTGSFNAPPATSAADLKFIVYGDSQLFAEKHNQVAGAIVNTINADPFFKTFILRTGDLVQSGGSENSWEIEFFNPALGNVQQILTSVPYMSARGNHDSLGDLFQKYFTYPFQSGGCYWSFDYGPAHIAIVDQYVSYSTGSPQLIWLANDLVTSTKSWKFIVLHEPGWTATPAGAVGHTNNLDVQTYIQPLCESYGVSFVFAGHNHYYARAVVNGVQHITTGGGGAPTYDPVPGQPKVVMINKSNHFCKIEITGSTLNFTAVKSDGSVIDTFSIP